MSAGINFRQQQHEHTQIYAALRAAPRLYHALPYVDPQETPEKEGQPQEEKAVALASRHVRLLTIVHILPVFIITAQQVVHSQIHIQVLEHKGTTRVRPQGSARLVEEHF